MKREKKALILASIAALLMLCGCSKKANTIEKDDGTYIESNGEYVKLNLEPKEFEAGKHIIYYVYKIDTPWYSDGVEIYSGYDAFGNVVPETPEGYKLINIVGLSDNDGYTNSFAFFYVNEVPVVVNGKLNPNTGVVEYLEPGEKVSSLTLENSN